MSWTRRDALAALALLPAFGALPRVSLAAAPGEARLLLVLLRGGLDGLAAVPPLGEPEFARARPRLAEAASAPMAFADGFGLHPALAPLTPLVDRQELLAVHAVSTPYRGRSHFAAQDWLECGGASARDGWLNRGLLLAGGKAVSLTQAVPLALAGPAPVSTVAPHQPPPAAASTLERVQALYADEPALAEMLAMALADKDAASAVAAADRRRPELAWQGLGQLLAAPDGPRVGLMELGGWDTHTRQSRRLESGLGELAAGLAALPAALGSAWSHTVVVVVSEFGRAVAENGTGGTDHGTGGVALLAGGAVAGGRVLADWPGLATRSRLEGRDLRPTLDLRVLLKGVLRDHLGLSEGALGAEVFPDSRSLRPLDGLVRGT